MGEKNMAMKSIRHHTFIRPFTAGLLLLAALWVGGCADKASPPSGNENNSINGKKEVVIRLPDTLSDLAYVAEEKGFFAKEGIRIQWTGKQAHGPANIVSIAAGQNDAAASISTAMIQARKAGNKVRIVVPSSVSSPNG